MNSPVQRVDIAIFPIEVDGVSIIFFLEYSTAQRTYSSEHWIPFATTFGCKSLISTCPEVKHGSQRLLRETTFLISEFPSIMHFRNSEQTF